MSAAVFSAREQSCLCVVTLAEAVNCIHPPDPLGLVSLLQLCQEENKLFYVASDYQLCNSIKYGDANAAPDQMI